MKILSMNNATLTPTPKKSWTTPEITIIQKNTVQGGTYPGYGEYTTIYSVKGTFKGAES